MPFDPSTAAPEASGFDVASAKPVFDPLTAQSETNPSSSQQDHPERTGNRVVGAPIPPTRSPDTFAEKIAKSFSGTTLPQVAGAARVLGANELADFVSQSAPAQDESKDAPTQIARGVGGAGALLAEGMATKNIAVPAIAAGLGAYEHAYQSEMDTSGDHEKARSAARMAIAKTVPEMAAMIAGVGVMTKVGGAIAVRLGGKAVAQFVGKTLGGATGGQAVQSATAAVEGGDASPSVESATQNLLFGAAGAVVESQAKRPAKVPNRSATQPPSEERQAPTQSPEPASAPAPPTAPTQDTSGQAQPENIVSKLRNKADSVFARRMQSSDDSERARLWEEYKSLEKQADDEEAKTKTPEASIAEVASAEPPPAPKIENTPPSQQQGEAPIAAGQVPPTGEATSPKAEGEVPAVEPPISVGPGAANAAEFPEQRTTGLKKDTVKDERLARGLEDLPPAERKAVEPAVQKAEDATESDPTIGPKLVARILEGDTAISQEDAAVLLVERNRLLNERDVVQSTFDDSDSTVAEKATAQEWLDEMEKKNEELDRAQRLAGSEWGRVGKMYQQMIKEDFSVDQMKFRKRKAEGRPLTPEESSTIEAHAKKIEEQQKEVDRLQDIERQATEAAEVARTHEATIKDLQSDIAGRPKFGKEVFEIAHKIVNRWKAEADTARLNLRNSLRQTNVGVNPALIIDVAKIIRAHIGEFGLGQAESFGSLIQEFGEEVRPYLSKAWAKAQSLIGAEKAPPKAKAAVKEGVKKKGEKTPVDIMARIKSEVAAKEPISHQSVYSLVRSLLNEGVAEGDALAAAHKQISELYPEISQRDVNRAYVDYGKKIHPSKEELAVKMRHLHQATKIQEDIDRLEKDVLRPEKQGYQRDKVDQQIRDLIKKRNDLLKQYPGPPEPGKLASRDEAKQIALKNAIEDLDRELQTGIKKDRAAGQPDSPATERLRAELNAMREKKAEIDAAENPGKSEADKQMDALSKIKQRLDDTLSGAASPKASKPFEALSQSAEDMKAEILAMQELAAQMRRDAVVRKSPEARALEQLEKSIADLDAKIAAGDLSVKNRTSTTISPEIDRLRAERAAMTKQLADMRRAAAPKTDPSAARELAQIKALEKQIDEYSRKVREVDFSTKGTQQGPPNSKRIVELRSILASRRSMYEIAKKLNRPVLTPEQRYNATRMKAVAKQLVDIRARIASGKFTRPAKRVPLAKDSATIKAEAELQKEKDTFTAGVLAAERNNRTKFQKFTAAIANLNRVNMLGHISVLEHLVGAALENIVTRPVGTVLAQLFRFNRTLNAIRQKAAYEGRISAKSEFAGITGTLKSGKALWDKLLHGKSDIDWLHKAKVYPKEFLEIVSNVHGAIKEPVRQGIYSRSLQLRIEAAREMGLHPETDKVLRNTLSSEAYRDANMDIFMGDNFITKAMHNTVTSVLRANKTDPGLAKFTADVLDVIFPIVNVSTNIAIRKFRLGLGLAESATRLGVAAKRGELRNNADKLAPRDAELITKSFKYGLTGMALGIYAWKHPEQFGGVFVPGKNAPKDKKPELEAGEIALPGGGHISHHLAHGPVGGYMNIVADAKRVYNSEVKDHPENPYSAMTEAAFFTMFAGLKDIPTFSTVGRLTSPFKGAGQKAGEMLRNMLVFGGIQDVARHMDEKKRVPKNFTDEIKVGIPGLRETVGESKAHKKHGNERIPIHPR